MSAAEVFGLAVAGALAGLAFVAVLAIVLGYLFGERRRSRAEWEPVTASAVIRRERSTEIPQELLKLPGGQRRYPRRR